MPEPSGGGDLGKHFSTEGRTVTVYTTARDDRSRMRSAAGLKFVRHGQPVENQVYVFVDPSKRFQTFLGVGGAITDASAETFAKLPAGAQQELIKAYYDPKDGIGYTLARTNIHSCDFSSGSYTYVADGDKELKTFSVEHDKQFRIPMIKRAISAAGGKLTLFASPWSPPAWMKDNNDMLHGGKLKPEFYRTWAGYYAKFIKAYEKEGVPVWGVSLQNEPMATQRWESCLYTAEEERDFLKNDLGPALKKAGLGDKKLIVWDHNRDLLYQRANTLLSDPEAARYAWGVGFHWYEDWSGGDQMFDNVKRVMEKFPGRNIMCTEACNSPFSIKQLNDWKWGERYGKAMINDFNNGSVGWTDWNILLDETGGPNHVQNFCFAPVHGDTKTGKLIYTSAFYYIGHFSKYIRPGARKIISSPSRSPLLSTAFMNPDGTVAVVVMNQGDKKITYNLWIDGVSAPVESPAHSIATLLF
jgi:glucosylceramidase